MEFKNFVYSIEDGIAMAMLDVPNASMNTINNEVLAELEEIAEQLANDDNIRGLIIGSNKDTAFLAGADLRDIFASLKESMKKPPKQALLDVFRLSKLFRKIETSGVDAKSMLKGIKFPKPVVSIVDGLAYGGGFELILSTHHVIASDNPKVKFALPEVLIGIFPGAGGTQRLPRKCGFQQALKICTTGRPIDAPTALGLGIIDDITSKDQLLNKAKEFINSHKKSLRPWDKKGFKYPGGSGAMHPVAVQTMVVANAMAQDKSKHNYPSVQAILSCIYEGSIVPFDTALMLECKYFYNILKDPVSQNMIRTLFVNKQAAEKGLKRPKNVAKSDIKTIGVLGAGMMGAGISYVSAKVGLKVKLLDQTIEGAQKGKSYSEKILQKSIDRGKITQEKADKLLDLITPIDDVKQLEGVDLIIEAVFEDPKVKKSIIENVQKVTGKDIIFASNTSTLPITGLAEYTLEPSNFIGVHFFSPVDKMPLVEIIKGKKTGDKALAMALDYVKIIKKTPIVVNDRRGFYVNSVVIPYLNEAMIMVKEGIKPALIENAASLLGMPVGPLALSDETSLELGLKISNSAKEQLGDKYKPTGAEEVLELMVNKLGRLGRKSGGGFYTYPKDSSKYLWEECKDYFPIMKKQPSANKVKERLLYILLVMSCNCLGDGTLDDPASADIGAIFGFGFAPYTGGPMSYIDTIGVDVFVKKADEFAKMYGKQFKLSEDFLSLAKSKKYLYS